MGIEEKERLIDLLDSISTNESMWDKFTKSLTIDDDSYNILSLEKAIKYICDIEDVFESTTLSSYQKEFILDEKNKLFSKLDSLKNNVE